jgi:hypothetical protein
MGELGFGDEPLVGWLTLPELPTMLPSDALAAFPTSTQ